MVMGAPYFPLAENIQDTLKKQVAVVYLPGYRRILAYALVLILYAFYMAHWKSQTLRI